MKKRKHIHTKKVSLSLCGILCTPPILGVAPMASCMLGKFYTRRLYFWFSFALYLKWGLAKLCSSTGWPCPCEPYTPGSPAAWVIDLCHLWGLSWDSLLSSVFLDGQIANGRDSDQQAKTQIQATGPMISCLVPSHVQEVDPNPWADETMPCPLSRPSSMWRVFFPTTKAAVVGTTAVGMWSLSQAQRF